MYGGYAQQPKLDNRPLTSIILYKYLNTCAVFAQLGLQKLRSDGTCGTVTIDGVEVGSRHIDNRTTEIICSFQVLPKGPLKATVDDNLKKDIYKKISPEGLAELGQLGGLRRYPEAGMECKITRTVTPHPNVDRWDREYDDPKASVFVLAECTASIGADDEFMLFYAKFKEMREQARKK